MAPTHEPTKPRAIFLGGALGLSIVLTLIGLSASAYFSANAWVDHTVRVHRAADGWLTALLDAETDARGFIISGETEFLGPYRAAVAREREYASELGGLVVDNPEQVTNVERAKADAEGAMDRLHEIVALVRSGHQNEAINRFSPGASKTFREDIRRLIAAEERLLVERRTKAQFRAFLALGAVLLLSLLATALLIFAWRLQRERERALDAAGKVAQRRLETLSDVAMALSESRSRQQVADVVVGRGMRAALADTCTLYLLNERGDALELIGDSGVAPEVLDKIRRVSKMDGNPATFEAFEAGKTIWAENQHDYAALFPGLSRLKVRGRRAQAFWSVPLVAEGRPVGLVGMGFYDARTLSIEERSFVETLTNQCAQALLRASRLEREDEARRWFTTTLRSIGDAVIATDPQGRITFMNPVAERLTGWPEKEAIGQGLDQVFCIYSEVTRAVVESPVAKVLREGTVVGLANHTLLRSRNGAEIPIDDSGAPIRTEQGRLAGVVLVFRDVTHEKRERVRREFLAKAGEALVSSFEYRTTLATVAQLAVPAIADWCVVDVLGATLGAPLKVAVAHVDPAKVRFARELGERFPPNPAVPSGVVRVIRSGISELHREITSEMLEAAVQDPEHLRMLRELKLESAMVVPLRAAGRTLGAVTFVYAESGRRYNEDDLAFAEDFARRAAVAVENAMAVGALEEARLHEQDLRNEAEIASRAKDEFLAMVSHELRTPLTAILGWAVMLQNRSPGTDLDRGLAVIERNARAQTKLIEDVLDVSRIISGKLSLSVGPVDLAEVVGMAVETVLPAASAKEITIVQDLERPSATITADADRLQQIVWNLLSNAVKFTPKGGKVSVRTHRQGSEVCVSVQDTGEGIRPDALPFVFEPFRQADATTTRRHGGLGLGLAIVKQLVTAHGGTVRAESGGDGKGSSFTVSLPARAAVPAISRPQKYASTVDRPTLPRVPRLDGLKVLVVDDEEDALELVSSVLEEYGAEVHRASSASHAIETLGSVKPDVIVSDIGMPGMDGYALMKKIRSATPELGGRIPAVALSAYARAEDAQRAFAAGFQMHVTKPVEPAQLGTVVASLGGKMAESG